MHHISRTPQSGAIKKKHFVVEDLVDLVDERGQERMPRLVPADMKTLVQLRIFGPVLSLWDASLSQHSSLWYASLSPVLGPVQSALGSELVQGVFGSGQTECEDGVHEEILKEDDGSVEDAHTPFSLDPQNYRFKDEDTSRKGDVCGGRDAGQEDSEGGDEGVRSSMPESEDWDGPGELEVVTDGGEKNVRSRQPLPLGTTWGPFPGKIETAAGGNDAVRLLSLSSRLPAKPKGIQLVFGPLDPLAPTTPLRTPSPLAPCIPPNSSRSSYFSHYFSSSCSVWQRRKRGMRGEKDEERQRWREGKRESYQAQTARALPTCLGIHHQPGTEEKEKEGEEETERERKMREKPRWEQRRRKEKAPLVVTGGPRWLGEMTWVSAEDSKNNCMVYSKAEMLQCRLGSDDISTHTVVISDRLRRPEVIRGHQLRGQRELRVCGRERDKEMKEGEERK
ncbi:hypothetical protein NFI96_007614 [Prochilodus magdalenae]|nr:hypothetical protein NFI96_007614 [Prochilodus magdalenae]